MERPVKLRLVIPRPLDAAGLAARIAAIPTGCVGAGVTLEPVAVDRTPADSSEYERTFQTVAVVGAAVSAEEEGYDAIVLDGIGDPGLYALRSRLSIPVVGAGLAAYTVAVTLGRTFSILVPPSTLPRREIEATLQLYALEGKCSSIRELGAEARSASDDLDAGLLAAARAALEEDGADVLIVGATSLHATVRRLADALPCPVVDPGLVALQVAERTLLLGLSHSKVAFPAPRTIQDEKLSRLIAEG
jgi:allantoin racemase